MTFNPLEEKGIPVDRQLRAWTDIVKRPFNKCEVDCYSRTRQILMNGIEVEAWNFKHAFNRFCPDTEIQKAIAQTRRIEDMQQTTVNWLTPACQTVLETTLGYEQVAVDLTAWLAQNEPDEYVKETFNFGLLEDFDHLYRYSQWAYMEDGIDPNDILQGMTDVVLSRPTFYHHNDNRIRLRRPYDKNTASPQTKVNIMTLVAGEQQTHNFYAEHGMEYGNDVLRRTFGEICDVEEEHVTMYESLMDPTETWFEKLVLHEFTEICTYHNCYKDEVDPRLKSIWEEFMAMEIGHLKVAVDLLKKYDKKDPEEVIGKKVVDPCHFESQKEYVTDILENEIGKRLDGEEDMGYTTVDELPEDWPSYEVQEIVNAGGSPNEQTIDLMIGSIGRDIVFADKKLAKKEPDLLARSLEPDYEAPNMVSVEEYEEMQDIEMIDFLPS